MRVLPRFFHRHGYHRWCRLVSYVDFSPEWLIGPEGERIDITTFGGTRRWRHE